LSGRRAFDGESRDALAASLTTAPTPSSGSPLVDRLVVPCLNKRPEMRSPRMQRVIMELKLLSVAARRAEMASGGGQRRDTAADLGAVREEVRQLEARLAARLQVHEKSVSETQLSASETASSLKVQMAAMNGELATNLQQAAERYQAVSETASSLKEQMAAMSGELATSLQQAAERDHAANEAASALKAHMAAMSGELAASLQQAAERDKAANDAILARVDQGFEALDTRIAQIERSVEELRGHSSQFEHNIGADLVDLEQNLKVQTVAIESARTAMSQTDDLVERVVEALESLQMAVMDQAEGGDRPNFAVN
jgi:uncharacterized protein YdcH (DUF465 family)